MSWLYGLCCSLDFGEESFSSWAPKSLKMVTASMELKDACFWEEKP